VVAQIFSTPNSKTKLNIRALNGVLLSIVDFIFAFNFKN